MPDITIERYQVCLVDGALGLADPALQVVGPAYRTLVAAQAAAERGNQDVAAGLAEVAPGQTYTTRATPGNQTVTVVGETREDLLAELPADTSVVLRARMTGIPDIRMTTLTVAELRRRPA